MTAIRELRDDERDWANAIYRDIQFAASPPGCTGVVAELAGERVGIGRLVELGGALELGGIWTAPGSRGRGVARAIVDALLERWSRRDRLWCIPFTHLAPFYRSCGFDPAPSPWPAPIAAKVGDCSIHAAGVVVLARDP